MMTSVRKLLDVRRLIASKRPRFFREGSQRCKRICKRWRRPKGLHSKMRHQFAGHRKRVKVGFRGPLKVRGLHSSGLEPVHISSVSALDNFDPKVHIVIISSKLGLKKRILLLEKIIEKGFKVFQFKDPSKKLSELRDFLKHKKDMKTKKEKLKKDKKKKEAKKPELEEKVLSADDKKKQSQKNMEKVLTKRG